MSDQPSRTARPEAAPAGTKDPTFWRDVLFWVVGALVLLFFLWMLSGILLPFVAGLAVAYMLDPVADKLEEWGLSRLAATSLITVFFILIGLVSALLLLPLLADQAVEFIKSVPDYAELVRGWAASLADGRLAELVGAGGDTVNEALSSAAQKALNWLLGLGERLLSGGVAVAGFISLMVVTPIVAFYMLLDWDNMIARADALLPRRHAATVRTIARDIDAVLAGFVRGQGTVCLSLGLFYGIGLSIAGLNFGLVVGLMSGLLSFIPYVGSITGFIVAGGLALLQFWPDPVAIGIVLGIFVVGQFIEGNFLTPKLVGSRVRLHPLWVIFALFAFGYLMGFVGMLLAVPIAAAFGVLVRFAVEQYLASPFYRDGLAVPVAQDDQEPDV